MSNADIARGRVRKFAWVEETTSGTLEDHAAADYVRHEGASISFSTVENAREDRSGGLAPDHMIVGLKEGEWSFPENHLCPSGSVDGTSEFDALLEALCGSVASVASTTATGGTASEPILTTVADIEAGDIVYFATTGEAGLVDVVEDETDTLTLTPALSTAPTASEVVVIGKQFRPAAADDAIITGTAVIDEDHSQFIAPGCPVNEGTISFSKGESVKFTCSGPASGQRSYSGTSALGSSAADDATTFALEDGGARKFDVSGGDIYASIGSEVVKVTAVDYTDDELTVARAQKSTDAAAHDSGTEIGPWFATPTKTGDPVVGIAGNCVLEVDGERYVPKLQSASMTISNGIVPDSDYGFAYRNHFRRDGQRPRAVTWELELRFDQDSQRIFGSAARYVEMAVCVWAGDTAGDIVAIGSRNVRAQIPSRGDAGGEDVTLSISGTALASAVDLDDEFRVALL